MENKVNETVEKIAEEFSQHWLRFAALSVTGVLTGLAAWNFTHNWLFVLALVVLAEGASVFWANQIEKYGNTLQLIMSIAGTVVSWVAITVTDLASATIIAQNSNLEIFSAFAKVPAWAQNTVVYVIPMLAVTNGILATIHFYFSESANMKRKLGADLRDAKYKIKKAKTEAEVNISKAQANRWGELAGAYSENVGISRAEAEWRETSKSASTPEGINVSASTGTGTQYDAETVLANPTKPSSKK